MSTAIDRSTDAERMERLEKRNRIGSKFLDSAASMFQVV